MHAFAKQVWGVTLDALFPGICLYCEDALAGEDRARWLCADCFARAPIATAFTCPVCRARQPVGVKRCHRAGFRLAAATFYANPLVRSLIWRLKYNRELVAAVPLADLLVRHLGALTVNVAGWVLAPVPLHAARERERGFNQSREIALCVSRATGVPLQNLLVRTRNTRSQAELEDTEARSKNVAGSFALAPQFAGRVPGASAQGKRILLVDDVFTSGATARDAVRALRAAGAKAVVVLVAARA